MLTEREQDTLTFLEVYFQENHKAPRLADIGLALNIKAMAHVSRLLSALEDKGFIKRTSANRGILLNQPFSKIAPSSDPGLPFMGRIAAGSAIEAIVDEEHIDINAMLAGNDHFVLKVAGQSMQDIGIMDQDWVVIKSTQHANNNDVVAVMINGWETTLKRIQYIDEKTTRLIPENSEMEPIDYHPEQLTIQGVLVGQFRRY
ncbi:MAG: transcriptional repressor LexA [Marinicella sp.]